ncbi:MAG TPA: GNAT family N-acetyltransferase, partial [Gemmatimonadaceae bacterium]|nr:GNAT family N-acetyltransferase [Gemmatimonadaceae bacterium]
ALRFMPELIVRRATGDDAADVAHLFSTLGYPIEPDDVPSRLARLDASSDAVLLAMDETGNSLGLIALHVFPIIHVARPLALITGLVVSPDSRGRGVGRTLVEAARAWALERKCDRLMVTSAEHRIDAHAFYPAVGMPYTGRRFVSALPQGL